MGLVTPWACGKTLESRKACNMPVWLDPLNAAVPSRAR